MGCKDIEIRKSEFVNRTKFLFFGRVYHEKKKKIPQKYAHEQVNHKKNKPQTHEELRSLDTIM